MYRNHTNANLNEELEGREMAIMQLTQMGGRENYKNVHRNRIRAIKKEMARRWRAQAVAKNRVRRNRVISQHVSQAERAFLRPLYKPRTATSPAGSRSAKTIGKYIGSIPYANVQAMIREMLYARRKLAKK